MADLFSLFSNTGLVSATQVAYITPELEACERRFGTRCLLPDKLRLAHDSRRAPRSPLEPPAKETSRGFRFFVASVQKNLPPWVATPR